MKITQANLEQGLYRLYVLAQTILVGIAGVELIHRPSLHRFTILVLCIGIPMILGYFIKWIYRGFFPKSD
jgi:hypothetical protein